MNALTPKQREVFKFVKGYMKRFGYPPTRKEISDSFGWASVTAAQQHLRLIELKGYIKLLGSRKRAGSISRGIAVLK